MGLELARAFVVARGDVSGVPGDIRAGKPGVEAAAGDLKNSVNRILSTIGVGLSFAALSNQIRGFLKLSGGFEQTTIAFETMIGNAEETKETLADLTEFAAKTPFEMPEIESAARGLIMFGERGEELLKTLNFLGDAASGTSTPFGFLALVFNQVRGVGKLLTQDFRQLSTRGILSLQDIATHFKVATAEAQKMLSKGKISFKDFRDILQAASGEGGRFANLMEKQSTSYLGLLSTLTDQVNLVKRAFGEGLMPVAKEFVTVGIQAADMVRIWVTENKILAASLVLVTTALVGLTGAMLTFKLVGAAVVMAMVTLKGIMVGLSGVIGKTLIFSIAALSIALDALVAHPAIAALAVLAAGIAVVGLEWKKTNEIIEEGNRLTAKNVDKMKEQEEALTKQVLQLLELGDAGKLNNEDMVKAQKIIDELEGYYGSLGLRIDQATGSIMGMETAIAHLARVNRRLQATGLIAHLADLDRQYDKARENSLKFWSVQSYWAEEMVRLDKLMIATQKELFALRGKPVAIPGVDLGNTPGEIDDKQRERQKAAAKAAFEARKDLFSKIKGLDPTTVTNEFNELHRRVSSIIRQFPELEGAGKRFLELEWNKTPFGNIQKQLEDATDKTMALRNNWENWRIELVKFSRQPWVTPEQIESMGRMLKIQDQAQKKKSQEDRFKDAAGRIREELQTPVDKMIDFVSEIKQLAARGRQGLPGGLTQTEAIERLKQEGRGILEGRSRREGEGVGIGAGRFGFAQYGKSLQDAFLKADEPGKMTAKNTTVMRKSLILIDQGIAALVGQQSKFIRPATYAK